MRYSVLASSFCLILLFGCSDSNSPTRPPQEAMFRIAACDDQTFQVRMTDRGVIEQARSLVGSGQQKIINGTLARGDGGFNQPWSWHFVPSSINFADVTVEVCDGCPQMVEQDLDYWIDTVGRFCPWTTRVVEEIQ